MAQRKKLRDTLNDDMVMGINISRVFSSTTYPWPVVVYSCRFRSVTYFS